MLPFGVTIPATVPQGSEIPEGLTNNPVFLIAVHLLLVTDIQQSEFLLQNHRQGQSYNPEQTRIVAIP
jgi:hypothetical protein